MRATIPLAVSSLTLVLAGCGGPVRLTSVPAECTPTTEIAVTYVNVRRGDITVDNECIHVVGGSTVTLRFSPTPTLEQARTRYWFPLGNRWLKRTNDDPTRLDRIVVEVPARDDEGFDDYKFDIRIKGVRTLDPRIVVQ